MRIKRIVVTFMILFSNLLAAATAHATLIPNPDGQRIYDTTMKVMWAANANLAGTKENNFDGALGLPTCDKGIDEPCVDAGGAMSYALRGTKLTDAQADYLIALAQATADARIFPPVPPPRPCAPHCV